ncbi:MAG TPA: low molecular weight protein-tyrosine-phosphatase [Bacteroidales bacterium]|nr:low molecular weight protein-tyrosine-phosphatase [Bacteroidales bacterium]
MKILFVCLGNICRSPLAEAIFTHKAKQLGLNVEANSAGFESFHRGDPADPRSVAVARAHGIDLSEHRARMFAVRDFDHYDRIYVMDRNNYNDVMGVARDSKDEKKVDYMLNLVYPGENRPVPDPWYGGKEGFEKVYQMLDEACENLINELSHPLPPLQPLQP